MLICSHPFKWSLVKASLIRLHYETIDSRCTSSGSNNVETTNNNTIAITINLFNFITTSQWATKSRYDATGLTACFAHLIIQTGVRVCGDSYIHVYMYVCTNDFKTETEVKHTCIHTYSYVPLTFLIRLTGSSIAKLLPCHTITHLWTYINKISFVR